MGEEILLTVQEAAKETGMSETGLRNAINRGSLPFVEKYGRKLIRAEDLANYRATVKMGRPRKLDAESAP